MQQLCSGQNSIRLTQFHLRDTIGRLEVCAGGIWGSVCSNRVTAALAEVACRELNHAARGTFGFCNPDCIIKSISLQACFMLKMIIPFYLVNWCQSEEPMLCALAMRLRFQSVPLMELMEMRLVLMRMTLLLCAKVTLPDLGVIVVL